MQPLKHLKQRSDTAPRIYSVLYNNSPGLRGCFITQSRRTLVLSQEQLSYTYKAYGRHTPGNTHNLSEPRVR